MEMQYAAAPTASTLSQLGNNIPKVFYSTQPLLITQASYAFFQKATNETAGADTNMDQPGNFSEGTRYDCAFVKFAITTPRAANPTVITSDTYTELMNWMQESSLSLRINNIEWFNAPLMSFMGNVNFGIKPDVAGDGVAIAGNSIPSNWYPMKTRNSISIPFESKVQFIWTLNTWDLTLTSTAINNFRFKLMMAGNYTYQK